MSADSWQGEWTWVNTQKEKLRNKHVCPWKKLTTGGVYFTSTSINANISPGTYKGEGYVVGQQAVANGQHVMHSEVWEWVGMNLRVRSHDSRFAWIYKCVKVRVKVRAGIQNHKRFIRTWKGSFCVTTRRLGDEKIFRYMIMLCVDSTKIHCKNLNLVIPIYALHSV